MLKSSTLLRDDITTERGEQEEGEEDEEDEG